MFGDDSCRSKFMVFVGSGWCRVVEVEFLAFSLRCYKLLLEFGGSFCFRVSFRVFKSLSCGNNCYQLTLVVEEAPVLLQDFKLHKEAFG